MLPRLPRVGIWQAAGCSVDAGPLCSNSRRIHCRFYGLSARRSAPPMRDTSRPGDGILHHRRTPRFRWPSVEPLARPPGSRRTYEARRFRPRPYKFYSFLGDDRPAGLNEPRRRGYDKGRLFFTSPCDRPGRRTRDLAGNACTECPCGAQHPDRNVRDCQSPLVREATVRLMLRLSTSIPGGRRFERADRELIATRPLSHQG